MAGSDPSTRGRSPVVLEVLFYAFYGAVHGMPYSPFPRKWDLNCSSECKLKSWMVGRFESTGQNRETQIPRYLAVPIRIEIWVEFEFLCISRYKFKSRFLFDLNLRRPCTAESRRVVVTRVVCCSWNALSPVRFRTRRATMEEEVEAFPGMPYRLLDSAGQGRQGAC